MTGNYGFICYFWYITWNGRLKPHHSFLTFNRNLTLVHYTNNIVSFPFYNFQPVFRVYPQTLLVSTNYYLILKYYHKLINFLLIFQNNIIKIEMSRQYDINNETNAY